VVSRLRTVRIAERIQQELADLLLRDVSDPRLVGVSITGAKVDRELAFADVHISAVEGSERSEEILDALYHAQGFLRTELANRIDLRVFPRLRFHWDETPETADRMERLFAQLRKEREAESGEIE
jgi:ribosome-binding factor A